VDVAGAAVRLPAEVPVEVPVEVTGAAARRTEDAAAPAVWVTADVTGVAAWLTAEVTGAAAWLTVEVTGAAALATVEPACDTVAEAWLTVEPAVEAAAGLPAEAAVEPAGLVTLETTPLTALVTPVTVLVTVPSRPPPEPEADGGDEAGVAAAARLVVAAWALEPDRSQKTAIRPRQQAASIRARSAIRPARLWPADTHASGTAHSTPLQPP
jgi:hypothetical protein